MVMCRSVSLRPRTALVSPATLSRRYALRFVVCYLLDPDWLLQYAVDKYNIDLTGTRISQLNRAITKGADEGIFFLPKGPSGKVKLPPKNAPAADSKEVCNFTSAPMILVYSCSISER